MDINRIRQVLTKVQDVTEFTPTEAHRMAKSRFWSFFSSGDSLPPPTVTIDLAAKHAGDRRILDWWNLDGFSSWFSNKDDFRQRVEFLADLALDQLYVLLKSPETAAPAKVAAIRMIMDVGQKIASKAPKEESPDDKISRMTKPELEAYIKDRVTRLMPADNEAASDEVTPYGN
jgi:hypothetical protein